MSTYNLSSRAARAPLPARLRTTIASPPFWLWSFGLCLLIAVGLLWPLPARLHTHTIDTGDALHLAWTVRWAQATLLGQAPPFVAPAAHPLPHPLLFNPPLYAMALLGLPLHLLGWSPSAVYGALTILSFAGTAWATALLGRQVSGSAPAGIVAGIGYAFSDVRLAHLAHLNLLSSFWTILLLWLIARAWQQPPATWRGRCVLALGAGCLAAAQALSDIYNAIFMGVAVGFVGLAWVTALSVQRLRRHAWSRSQIGALAALLAGAVLALGLVAPVLLPTLGAWQELGVARSWDDHVRYAATPGHYLLPTHARALYDPTLWQPDGLRADPTEQRLWPGAITLGLALVGMMFSRGWPRRLALGLGGIALLLSFGPTVAVAGQTIELPAYRRLFEHVPLFSAARVPARWALLFQLALAVLSALGVARILAALPQQPATPTKHPSSVVRRPSSPVARAMKRAAVPTAATALLALLALDVRPTHIPTTTALVGEPTPAVYQALRDLPAGAVMEWPLENASPTLAHRYQYYGLTHGKPLVNTATSAPPQRYVDLIASLRSFPNRSATRLLADLGVRYVVINRWEIGTWPAFDAQLAAAPGLTLLGEYDDGRHRLYAVDAGQPAAPAPLIALSAQPHGAQLDFQLAAPLWLGPTGALYAADRLQRVTVSDQTGPIAQAAIVLPPVLLPGGHQIDLPFSIAGAQEVSIGGHHFPLVQLPEGQQSALPQLGAGPLPSHVAPGETLPCLARTSGNLPAGLVLAATLVDGDWSERAKRDHYLEVGRGILPCDLEVPVDLPAGAYFLALGLYDPAAGAFVPITGADGVATPGLWRVPQVIVVMERV